MKPSLFMPWIVVGCCALGCGADPGPCNPALQQGDQIEVEVHAVSSAPIGAVGFNFEVPSCALDDIRPGQRYSLMLRDHIYQSRGAGQCYQFKCPLDLPTSASTSREAQVWGAGQYVCLRNDALIELSENCTLARFTAISSLGDTDLDHGPSAGSEDTPFLLLRALTTVGATCTDLSTRYPEAMPEQNVVVCADQFRVQLTKVSP